MKRLHTDTKIQVEEREPETSTEKKQPERQKRQKRGGQGDKRFQKVRERLKRVP